MERAVADLPGLVERKQTELAEATKAVKVFAQKHGIK
jgi:hypothetical protein